MIKIVRFAPDHLEQLNLRPEQGEKPEMVGGNVLTFLHDEKPIAIVGWFLLAPGVAQCWALISEDVKKCPKSFHKNILLLLRWHQDKFEIRRFQMSVSCEFQTGWRWAKALGFTCEGIMKKYAANGSDCWLFGRVA
jgi:hypothetical protein